VDVGFLDNGNQGFLSPPPGFEQTREVAAFPQFGDAQVDCAYTGVPCPFPMPIAVRHSIRRPFVPLGANLSRHLNLNQFLRKKADCLAEKINISSTLVKKLLKCDPNVSGHD